LGIGFRRLGRFLALRYLGRAGFARTLG
jgi:hypothetical protein